MNNYIANRQNPIYADAMKTPPNINIINPRNYLQSNEKSYDLFNYNDYEYGPHDDYLNINNLNNNTTTEFSFIGKAII
jgi:hypothetical protein